MATAQGPKEGKSRRPTDFSLLEGNRGQEGSARVADEEFIDRIYEAAVVPEFWPEVLHELGEIAGARGTILLTADASNVRWVASPRLHEDAMAYVTGRWHERNTRLPRLLARRHAGFLREI